MKSGSTGEFLCKALASGLFVSFVPAKLMPRTLLTGAGMLGALWGVALLPLLPASPLPYLAFLVPAVLLSAPVAGAAERAFGRKDDPRIILDEIIGFWVSAAFLPRDFNHLAAAFVLFRVFDVLKPGPIRRLQDLPGGWGVVMDDVAAGALACALVHLARLGLMPYTTTP